jgi:hypothetical protein
MVRELAALRPIEVPTRPKPRPYMENRWTADLVGERLIEAYETVKRLPLRTGPEAFGNSWPEFQTMTKAEQAQLLNELQLEGRFQDYYREKMQSRVVPSSEEVSRMYEALAFPMRYLGHDKDLALIVTGWCDGVLRRPNDRKMPELVREGLGRIASGLNKERVRVR